MNSQAMHDLIPLPEAKTQVQIEIVVCNEVGEKLMYRQDQV